MTARRPCPAAPGPVEAYAAHFDAVFRRLAQRPAFRTYLAGLLAPRDRNKTLTALAGAEPIVQAQAPEVQRLQCFLSEAAWDADAVTARRIELLVADPLTAPHAQGVLVLDDTGDKKDGTATAHVGRQYLGRVGKIDHGIVAVTSLWADARVYYPLHVEPYTPAHWFAGGKQDPAFRTKPQIARTLVERARALGIPFRAGLCHVEFRRVASPACPHPPSSSVSDSHDLYRGYRFPREVIAHAVRLYLRFALSYRDVEALLAERGVQVSYETVRRWVAKFGAQYADELRRREVHAGRTWHLDEMATRVGGRLHWLWRAVDERGQTLDVFLQERRDTAAAEAFLRRLLAVTGDVAPEQITTDKLGSYAAALARLPGFAAVEHLQVRAALRCNNRVEQAHQPTRVRERVMRRFRSVVSAQRFLDAFSRVGNLLRPRRHILRAAAYRAIMRERAATWREIAGLQAA